MLAQNLKYLRLKHDISQKVLSETFDIPRTTLGDYERGKTEPSINTLIKLSDYFKIPVDDLIKKDLSLGEFEMISTRNMKVLAITVNDDQEGNIELVDSKAEAGYLEGFQNPEYIKDLPKIHLPDLPSGTFRAFTIQGDSMVPVEPGSIILAKYVDNLKDIKDNKTYVVIGNKEGLVYKRVRRDDKAKKLVLLSDNETYLPYDLSYDEVGELWQYHAHISFSDEKKEIDSRVSATLEDLKKQMSDIKKTLSN